MHRIEPLKVFVDFVTPRYDEIRLEYNIKRRNDKIAIRWLAKVIATTVSGTEKKTECLALFEINGLDDWNALVDEYSRLVSDKKNFKIIKSESL